MSREVTLIRQSTSSMSLSLTTAGDMASVLRARGEVNKTAYREIHPDYSPKYGPTALHQSYGPPPFQDENRDSNDNELETDEYYLNDNISKEMKIVKRSAKRCIEEKTEKKRKKCLKRQKRKKKERSTGKSLVRFVKTTVQKALGNSVEHIVAEAIRKGKGMSFMHFKADDNEEAPHDDFAGRFHKWQYSDWAYKRPDLKEKFMLYHTSGTVTIAEGGLYMLYAQVTLKGRPDQGFKVVARHTNNSENILMKCMMDYVSDGEQDVRTDGNITCSSVGVFRIDAGDSVFLTHSDHTNVKADFRENASFFGFVKLS